MPIKYNNHIGNDIPDKTYWNTSTKCIVLLNRQQLCTRGKWFGLLWNVIVRVVVIRMKYNGGGGCSSAIERMLCKLSAESFFRPSSYMMKKVFPPLLFSYNQYRDLMTGHEGKTMSSNVKGIRGNCGS